MRRRARAVAALVILSGAAAQGADVIATVERPLTIPLAPRLGAAPPGGRRHVIITVTGFTPSPSGPVEGVVSALCGAASVEVGRFGVMPQAGFTAADPDRAQRFSLPLRADLCPDPHALTIRLLPSQGSGEGAAMEIGGAELQ